MHVSCGFVVVGAIVVITGGLTAMVHSTLLA